jgi:deoxyhypusine monooxygenase
MSASFLSAVGARYDASAASVASATRAKPPPEGRSSCCEKYKQIFVLRNRTDADAVPELITLFHGTSSVLLRHEVAYVLGQMQRADAVPFLEAVLTDVDENPITRHEAAEALAGIGAPDSLAILTRHAHDAASEVSDTCGLALATIGAQIDKGVCGCERRPQAALGAGEAGEGAATEAAAATTPTGTDAPNALNVKYISPAPAAAAAPVTTLRAQLLDASRPLFERCSDGL